MKSTLNINDSTDKKNSFEAMAPGVLTEDDAVSLKLRRIIAAAIQKQGPVTVTNLTPLINRLSEKLHVDQPGDIPGEKFT